mgnify:CR=1 FL=1
MEVKTKITYSALKLSRKLPEMIANYIENIGEGVVKDAKERIDKIDYLKFSKSHPKMPQLSSGTLAERSAGTLAGKPYGKAKYGNIPLKYTGKLYNTMKATSSGISMEKYGWYHNLGVSDINPRIRRPKREFLDFKLQKGKKSTKLSGKANKEFNLQLSKNFRK